jgi:hypothetical protein
MRTYAYLLALATALAASPLPADARPNRQGHPRIVELPPLEARGCYYYRGERRCGSYCYWEVNGHRYCQTRQHDAYPQAELWIDAPVPASAPHRAHTGQRLK